jgi:hypothetical protein
MKRRSLSFLVVCIACLALPAGAEVSIRECIQGAPEGSSYRLVAGASADITSMGFNLYSTSDAVILVSIFHRDGTANAQTIRYNAQIDGTNNGRLAPAIQYFTRTTSVHQSYTTFRVFFQGVAAGNHTLTIKAINLSNAEVELGGIYIATLFLDSGESGVYDQRIFAQSVGGTWTQLAAVTLPPDADKHYFVSTYLRGSASSTVQFRYRVAGVVKQTYTVSFAGESSANLHLILTDASPGQVVELQGLGTSTMTVAEMNAQTFPKYSVLEASATDTVSVPYQHWALTPVLEGADAFLNALTLSGPAAENPPNQRQVCSWGYGMSHMSMTDSSEAETHLYLLENGTPFPWDISVIGLSPTATSTYYPQQSDIGCGIGLFSDRQYRLRQDVRALAGPAPLVVGPRRLQIMFMPAPVDAANHTCTSSHAPWCSYVCQMLLPTAVTTPRDFDN